MEPKPTEKDDFRKEGMMCVGDILFIDALRKCSHIQLPMLNLHQESLSGQSAKVELLVGDERLLKTLLAPAVDALARER